ncbi:putative MFS family arabinose efflux permease [Breznakia sp. PF5-3]|uniref:MFS transporter n=1 Tax=unclassified Breznakia TaxID=2623764 RepID=UPI0024055EEF|nr:MULTISPECIES: MFS transporter [unclassified Breznakia]MDF9823822.1 putative MFS family arabinose efflux permease [Breznakia sp. PM6-1]MDF9834612.1 putative MFS family arabinose efflux permease [Breznakia sp. PF5-3]MDF9836771.1 putative MFS family arabinose efflux permease [Breznakia sp. PFB2-8]MDF9858780.1 putative MFS family arabinose efflux permease [Breznakia sp. PH5-24]
MKITKNMGMMFVLYFISFISFAIPYAYMQTFLSYVGYDVLERGIILSGTAIVAIVAQFFIGYLCDKYQSDKKFYNILLIIFVVVTYVMYSVTDKIFFLHLIFISLVGGIARTVMAVQDTWCLETDNHCMRNYGAIRAFGAIGWMIGSPLGAMAIEKWGYGSLGIIFAVMTVFNIGLTFFMQDAKKHEKSVGITASDIKTLLTDKKYVLIVLIFLVINIIATADMYTVVDKMLALGAGEGMIGARWSIQAFTELPLFFAGGYLLKKFGDYRIMMFGTFMYIVRFIGYAIVQTPELMIAVALLQCVTYPLIMITSKTLVDDASPAHMRATGQTIASAIYIGVSALITPILAGLLTTLFSVDTTLMIIGLSGFISIALGIVYKRI